MSGTCLRGFVSGRVQGVGFRAFARREALKAGISGWAKNLPDGRVEVLLCGDDNAVQTVVAALRQGPPYGQVTAITLTPAPWPNLTGFTTG